MDGAPCETQLGDLPAEDAGSVDAMVESTNYNCGVLAGQKNEVMAVENSCCQICEISNFGAQNRHITVSHHKRKTKNKNHAC